MDKILLSYTFAFLITFFAIPIIIEVARRKKLFDEPDERKVHKMVIPTLGGLGIFGGFILATLIGSPVGSNELQYFVAAAIVIFFLGIKDDILVLSVAKKFIGQLIAAGIIIKFGGVQITNMHGFLGIEHIQSSMSVCLSFFTIIVIVNAFNLIDGVDGLAGTIGIIALISFGLWFFSIGNLTISLVAMTSAGAILGFLFFNWQPSKIFMGDTGALMIGFLLSYMAIQFINLNFALPANHPTKFQASISTAICIVIIPVFDTLRVIILRLRRMQSPFKADKNHLHHQFLNLGYSHAKTVLYLGAINLCFILLAWLLRNQKDELILPLVVLSCLLINYLLKKAQKSYPNNGRKN